MLLILYPKCSTCNKAKKYLEDNNITFNTRDIVLDTPNVKELIEIIKKSNKDIRKFFNTSGMKYRELDGMLIKRPLLVCDDKVLIGFKEKEWSEII